MKKLTKQQLVYQVTRFNATYKIGDKVEVLKIANGDETFIDEIKHEATIIGGHTAVTWLKGKGCYDLTFVCGKVEIREETEDEKSMRIFQEWDSKRWQPNLDTLEILTQTVFRKMVELTDRDGLPITKSIEED